MNADWWIVRQVQQQVEPQPVTNHGFQNEFLEDLARSQIVPDPKKVTISHSSTT